MLRWMGGARESAPAEEVDEAPEAFDATLRIPVASMDRIFAGATPQEKADAITEMLQARLDVAEA